MPGCATGSRASPRASSGPPASSWPWWGSTHGGTTPHDFVSLWFFLQAALASTAWGVGALLAGSRRGLVYILLGLSAPVVAQLIPWPSNGLEECFGALAIDAFVLLTFWEYRHPVAATSKTPARLPHTP